MKCLESIPNFGSRVEMATFLRTIADDIETGKAHVYMHNFLVQWDMGRRGLNVNFEIKEEK
jgi:hypothetical protein